LRSGWELLLEIRTPGFITHKERQSLCFLYLQHSYLVDYDIVMNFNKNAVGQTRLQITDLTSPTNILIALWRDAAAMACSAVFHAARESWSCHFLASTKASGWNDMCVATVLECRIQVFANQYSGPDGITTLKRIKCRHGVPKQCPGYKGDSRVWEFRK